MEQTRPLLPSPRPSGLVEPLDHSKGSVLRVRRLLAPAVTAVVLAVPTPALAAPTASVASPAPGSTIEGESPVTVRVRSNGEAVSSVVLRLSDDGRAAVADSRTVSASCLSGCGTDSSTWQAPNFRPETGAPFATAEVCNGYWWIQPSVNGGAYTAGTQFTLAALPDAPGGVSAQVVDHATGRAVELTWNANREPDIAAYAVERARDGGPFIEIIRLSASTTEYLDGGLATGSYDYRVVALRPDGVVDGRPAAPCDDSEADLAATSSTRSVRVEQPDGFEPDPEPQPSSGGTSGSEGGSTGGGSTGGSGTGSSGSGTTESGTSGSGESSTGSEQTSGTTSGSSSGSSTRRPVAPPPRASGSTADTAAPDVGGSGGRETYYGEGDEFSESIDYGEAGPVALDASGDDGDRGPVLDTDFVPQAMEDFVNLTVLDPDKMRTLAVGLLLVTIGMHFRRWLRAGR